jgi:hypothetical protein
LIVTITLIQSSSYSRSGVVGVGLSMRWDYTTTIMHC